MCCGRDTRSKFQVCARCLRGPRGSREVRTGSGGPTAEDDYSEESGPDSVYREREQWTEHEGDR
jgi:hypothetical protein